jgi:hypothetical protein
MDMVAGIMAVVLAEVDCKDAGAMQMGADVYLKIEAKTCAGKGTMKATWTAIEKAAADKMATLTACTAESALCDMSSSSSGDSDSSSSSSSSSTPAFGCCITEYAGMVSTGVMMDTCSAAMKKMMDDMKA